MDEPRYSQLISYITHDVGTETVGDNKPIGVVDRTIDMAFCGKMNDSFVASHSCGHEFAVTDVAFDELDARVLSEISQGVLATCVGKRIDDGDFIIAVGQ